jgi:multiple sugar transport system permease protein
MTELIGVRARVGPAPRRSWRWNLALGLAMWVLALLFVAPFIWMLVSSTKTDLEVFRLPIQWLPASPTFNNYVTVWTGKYPLTRYIGNSLFIATLRVIGDILTASLAAYGFSRMRFKGRDLLFGLYVSTMILPSQMLLVPRFILFQYLHIYNTHWALILPGAFTVFGTFLLRQFLLTIPVDLTDAAKIDGASDFQIYSRVIMPLLKPALGSLAIIAFVWSWNEYETALVMLTSESIYTIPLGMTKYFDDRGGFSPSLIMAGAVSATLPIFVVFLSMQRQFIETFSRSGIKG